MLVHVTLLFLKVWERHYIEELILNITVLVVRVWRGQKREELMQNVTVCCDGVGKAI